MRFLPRLFAVATMMATASLVALPASADPAGPTHYRSTVTSVEAADGEPVPVEVEVVGGDAFLTVRVEPGTRAAVPGYEGEPYLRIEEDGTVQLNQRSPARWLNDARYGAAAVEIPPIADPDAPPSWTPVAEGGEYAWHDHRIHFMSPSLPDTVDPSADAVQPVSDWSLPLTVEDRDVTVTGELTWVPGPAPAVPIALVGGALLAGSLLFLWRPSTVAPILLAAAAVTAAMGAVGMVGLPPGTEGRPALVVLPLIAVVVVAIGLGWRHREGTGRDWLVAAAGLPLLVWGILQSGVLTRPIVPGGLATGWARAATVCALGIGGAAVIVLVRRLAAATSLDVPTELPDR